MKMTTNYAPLFAGIERAFEAACDDVVEDAQDRAPKRSGKFSKSIRKQRVPAPAGRLEAVIGSPLASARVKEMGAFIPAKRHDRLFIPFGDGSLRTPQAVRIGAQPTVAPAGRKFIEHMTRRAREFANVGGGGTASSVRPDFRSGSVRF